MYLFSDRCISLLYSTAFKYNQQSLCKVSAKQHQNPDKKRFVIVLDVPDFAMCGSEATFMLHSNLILEN